VPLNFGGKIPQNWNFGTWIGLSSLTTKIQILITRKLLSRSWRHFYREYAPWMSLRGWFHGSPQQIQDGGGSHLWFHKNVNNSGLDKHICTKFYGKMHHCHAEMTTWQKVETGSWFAWRHQINVWSIIASISVSSANILTKFGTGNRYHNINTPEWPISHNLKIQDGGGRHLEFRKNVNNSGLDKDSCTNFIGRCITTTWPKVETES